MSFAVLCSSVETEKVCRTPKRADNDQKTLIIIYNNVINVLLKMKVSTSPWSVMLATLTSLPYSGSINGGYVRRLLYVSIIPLTVHWLSLLQFTSETQAVLH